MRPEVSTARMLATGKNELTAPANRAAQAYAGQPPGSSTQAMPVAPTHEGGAAGAGDGADAVCARAADSTLATIEMTRPTASRAAAWRGTRPHSLDGVRREERDRPVLAHRADGADDGRQAERPPWRASAATRAPRRTAPSRIGHVATSAAAASAGGDPEGDPPSAPAPSAPSSGGDRQTEPRTPRRRCPSRSRAGRGRRRAARPAARPGSTARRRRPAAPGRRPPRRILGERGDDAARRVGDEPASINGTGAEAAEHGAADQVGDGDRQRQQRRTPCRTGPRDSRSRRRPRASAATSVCSPTRDAIAPGRRRANAPQRDARPDVPSGHGRGRCDRRRWPSRRISHTVCNRVNARSHLDDATIAELLDRRAVDATARRRRAFAAWGRGEAATTQRVRARRRRAAWRARWPPSSRPTAAARSTPPMPGGSRSSSPCSTPTGTLLVHARRRRGHAACARRRRRRSRSAIWPRRTPLWPPYRHRAPGAGPTRMLAADAARALDELRICGRSSVARADELAGPRPRAGSTAVAVAPTRASRRRSRTWSSP